MSKPRTREGSCGECAGEAVFLDAGGRNWVSWCEAGHVVVCNGKFEQVVFTF